MFGYLFNYLSYKTGDTSFSNEGETPQTSCSPRSSRRTSPHVLIQGMPMFGGALMLVLGAIVAGNGYGWGTWKTVFTQGPSRRSRRRWARIAALTIFVVGDRAGHARLCFGAVAAGRGDRVTGGGVAVAAATRRSRSASGSW